MSFLVGLRTYQHPSVNYKKDLTFTFTYMKLLRRGYQNSTEEVRSMSYPQKSTDCADGSSLPYVGYWGKGEGGRPHNTPALLGRSLRQLEKSEKEVRWPPPGSRRRKSASSPVRSKKCITCFLYFKLQRYRIPH